MESSYLILESLLLDSPVLHKLVLSKGPQDFKGHLVLLHFLMWYRALCGITEIYSLFVSEVADPELLKPL